MTVYDLLLRQWLVAYLEPYTYMTIPVQGEDGDQAVVHAFQLLDLERKSIILRPFVDADDEAELQGLYNISVQPLELWRRPDEAMMANAQSLETFVFQPPTKIDLITALGGAKAGCARRPTILTWQARQSDVEGCVEMHTPVALGSQPVDLMSKGVPVLALLDTMCERGFVGVDRVVRHKQGVMEFDRRRIAGRRSYLQCVLHADKIAAKGVADFPSNGPIAYFEALLFGKTAVRPGLPATVYKQLMAKDGADGDAWALAPLDAAPERGRRASAAPPLAAASASPAALEDDAAGDTDDGSVVGCASPEREAVAIAQAIAAAASDSDNSVVGGGADQEHELAAPEVADAPAPGAREGVPESLLGVPVSYVQGRSTTTHTYADRIGVRCPNAGHGNKCGKSRSLALWKDRLGPRCAEGFLGAWLSKAHTMPAAAHAKYAPTVEETEAYLVQHS